jgi:hypothetical protein
MNLGLCGATEGGVDWAAPAARQASDGQLRLRRKQAAWKRGGGPA